jgi:hypothetical protein
MKIIVDKAVIQLRPTPHAELTSTRTRFCGDTIEGPIRCEFKGNALTIKGTWRNPADEAFDVEVPLYLSKQQFARAIQYALDCPRDRDRDIAPQLFHKSKSVVQKRLLQILEPSVEQDNAKSHIQFALSRANLDRSKWTAVNLLPQGLNRAAEYVAKQSDIFAKLKV